jgi:hypothetical protein
MDTKTVIENFKNTTNIWLDALDKYTEDEFKIKPADDAWSLGQVYQHIAKSAMFFQFARIKECLSSDEHGSEPMNERTIGIFKMGSFPPIEVKVPIEFQPTPTQPESKEEARTKIKEVITLMPEYATKIDNASHHGKAQHPALGYLNANEWFELIDMHFRHHLSQKVKIEKFIAGKK